MEKQTETKEKSLFGFSIKNRANKDAEYTKVTQRKIEYKPHVIELDSPEGYGAQQALMRLDEFRYPDECDDNIRAFCYEVTLGRDYRFTENVGHEYDGPDLLYNDYFELCNKCKADIHPYAALYTYENMMQDVVKLLIKDGLYSAASNACVVLRELCLARAKAMIDQQCFSRRTLDEMLGIAESSDCQEEYYVGRITTYSREQRFSEGITTGDLF